MAEDFRDELRAVARDLLATAKPDQLARQMADAGWFGLEVPEELGGAGATFAETAVVLEELGRAGASTACLGVSLAVGGLVTATRDAARDELLTALAEGTATATVALAAADDATPPYHLDHGSVSGTAGFVPDTGGRLLLLTPDALVEAAATVTLQPVLDEARSLATVAVEAAAAEHVWQLPHPESLRHRAALAVTADALGVAEGLLARTVDYAGVRQQFGRPIGSFQAVQHSCADALVQLQVGRRLFDAAVAALVAGDPDTGTHVARAKSYLGDAAVDVAGRAMQLHGGIGYTWESGIPQAMKRVLLDRDWFGTPRSYRRLLAARFS